MRRIFQIGFNKCGTTSFHSFFEENGLKSIHYDSGKLATRIFQNYKNKFSLLSGYEDYQCFTDMEIVSINQGAMYVSQVLFKELDRQYTNSLFVLNTRNIDTWINSRTHHHNGFYLSKVSKILGLSKTETISYWRKEFLDHHQSVENYFKNRDCLLVFDIEKEGINKLVDFLFANGIDTQPKYWVRHNIGSVKMDKELIIN